MIDYLPVNTRMRYLIIGDSWGCGEWGKDFIRADSPPTPAWQPTMNPGEYCYSFIVPDTDAGTYLRRSGNEVTNISIGGDSNINQLKLLADHLRKDSTYDAIIWFHTEPMRDWQNRNYELGDSFYREQLSHPTGYDRIVDTWYFITYSMAEDIYEQYRIPFMVIGGMTPLPDQIHKHSFVHCYIKDWANERILDMYCEHPHNAGQFRHFAEAYMDVMDLNRALAEAEASTRWIQTCCVHPSFPDWGHPDRRCHEELAKVIDSIIKDVIVKM